MNQKLSRNHAMTFRVTEEERDMITRRQEQSGIINMRTYLLKMAVDGRVIHVQLDSVMEMNRLLSNISNNINQVARKLNQGGRIYDGELEKIQTQQEEIWNQQKEILRKVSSIVDVAKKRQPYEMLLAKIHRKRESPNRRRRKLADGEAGLTKRADCAHFEPGFGGGQPPTGRMMTA